MPARRLGEYGAAAGISALAVAVSPAGIELATGRGELTFRVTCISFVLAIFLAMLAGALLTRIRGRRVFFGAIALSFPLAVLACLEFVAIAVHLADRVAPLEDTSILDHGGAWPGYLMTNARWQPGTRLYRPWQAPGISINSLGLRTRSPSPKLAGEWRVAITGGSAVWGWRVLDQDTIPGRLQQLNGNASLTFFNFGIEGATIAQELAILQQFRSIYEIDQVIFYTGANDAFSAYVDSAGGRKRLFDAVDGITSFELVKAATRFTRMMSSPSASDLKRLESELLQAKYGNRLRQGFNEADNYCNLVGLRCDFVLQPLLFTRSNLAGPEVQLVHTFSRLYPGFAPLAKWMYQDSLTSIASERLHDLSNMFARISEPVFTDNVHVSELGNGIAAERIAATVALGPEPLTHQDGRRLSIGPQPEHRNNPLSNRLVGPRPN